MGRAWPQREQNAAPGAATWPQVGHSRVAADDQTAGTAGGWVWDGCCGDVHAAAAVEVDGP